MIRNRIKAHRRVRAGDLIPTNGTSASTPSTSKPSNRICIDQP
jgi:hypothetical protein